MSDEKTQGQQEVSTPCGIGPDMERVHEPCGECAQMAFAMNRSELRALRDAIACACSSGLKVHYEAELRAIDAKILAVLDGSRWPMPSDPTNIAPGASTQDCDRDQNKGEHAEPWATMHGMPTNVLDVGGLRVARCDFDGDTSNPMSHNNAARIVACVNACAGMVDPAAEIAKLRAANEQLRADIEDLCNAT